MEDSTVPLLENDPDMRWAFDATKSTGTASTSNPSAPPASSSSSSVMTSNATANTSNFVPRNPGLAAIFQREMNAALTMKIMFTTMLEEDDEAAEEEEGDALMKLETYDVEGRPMRARYSFHGTDDDEADVMKNESLIAIGRNPHWVLVHVERTQTIGLVPATYVTFTDN